MPPTTAFISETLGSLLSDFHNVLVGSLSMLPIDRPRTWCAIALQTLFQQACSGSSQTIFYQLSILGSLSVFCLSGCHSPSGQLTTAVPLVVHKTKTVSGLSVVDVIVSGDVYCLPRLTRTIQSLAVDRSPTWSLGSWGLLWQQLTGG